MSSTLFHQRAKLREELENFCQACAKQLLRLANGIVIAPLFLRSTPENAESGSRRLLCHVMLIHP